MPTHFITNPIKEEDKRELSSITKEMSKKIAFQRPWQKNALFLKKFVLAMMGQYYKKPHSKILESEIQKLNQQFINQKALPQRYASTSMTPTPRRTSFAHMPERTVILPPPPRIIPNLKLIKNRAIKNKTIKTIKNQGVGNQIQTTKEQEGKLKEQTANPQNIAMLSKEQIPEPPENPTLQEILPKKSVLPKREILPEDVLDIPRPD